MRRFRRPLALIAAFTAVFGAFAASAQGVNSNTESRPIFGQYGGVGLLKTRTARMAEDSTLSTSLIWNDQQQRIALTFQAAPWLEATFSYSRFEVDIPRSFENFDRQFDLKVRLWEEGVYLPQVALGVQDFLGTGLFSGEYVVASKQVGPLDLSVGLGWGVLGSRGDLSNPFSFFSQRFDTRTRNVGSGGNVDLGQYFRGDVGFFGGVSYQTPIKGLQLVAEYDSDDNSIVLDRGDEPINLGLVYNPTPGIQLTASYLGLEDINLQASFSTPVGKNIQDEPPGDPPPLYHVREEIIAEDGGADGLFSSVQPPLFTPIETTDPSFATTISDALEREGIDLLHVQAGSSALRVGIENDRYRSAAKAVGRTARILSRFAPAEIETFQVVLVERGLDTGEFKLRRSLLEASAREIGYSISPPSLGFAYIPPGTEPVDGPVQSVASYPKFDWEIGPDVRYSAFDPDEPLRLELQAAATARVEFAPGLSVSGSLGREIFGNLDEIRRPSDSVLPRVRTEFARYEKETDIGVYELLGEYQFDIAPNLYGKVSAGLYEQMFGGVGGEVLFRPAYSRFAYGGELFYVKQRDFDTLFTFQDYNVVTGHASLYYDTPYANWDVALHVGRYLAGDWGGTLELSRRFANGWEVGAFATLTDVPFDEFGEGSFDKGIIVKIPIDWALPRNTKTAGNINLRPLQRDGGQRLRLGSRLFETTREGSRGEVGPQWDTFAH